MNEIALTFFALMSGIAIGIMLTRWSFTVKLDEAAESGRRLEWDGILYNVTEDCHD